MSISSDSELEKDEDHQEEIIEIEGSSLETISEEKSLVISEDIFPDSLLVVPLYDRPLFPKMLLPVIISDKKLEKVLEDELKGPLKYVGLVYSNETDEKEKFVAVKVSFKKYLKKPNTTIDQSEI